MTSSDTPPQGEPHPGTPGATATDEGPRVTRDDITDLGRLRRSRTDRHVSGVAGGLARHLDIDPIIVRVVFVVTAFFGGAGIFAYGALWLLVPEDGEDHAPVNLDDKARGVALIAVGVLAAIALLGGTWGGNWFPWPLALIALLAWFLLNRRHERRMQRYGQGYGQGTPPYVAPYGQSQTGWVGPTTGATAQQADTSYAAPTTQQPYAYTPPAYSYTPPPRPRDPRKGGPILFWFTLALIALGLGTLGIVEASGIDVAGSAYPALAVGISGLMLVVGAFWGRAGGLILLGLVCTIPLVVATVASNIESETVTWRPATAAQVQDRYYNGAGEMVVDLSDVTDVDQLDGRTITVEGGIGRLEVIVPAGMDVNASADTDGPGSVDVFGQENGGIDIYASGSRSAGDDRPTLEIDANLGVGEIVISQ